MTLKLPSCYQLLVEKKMKMGIFFLDKNQCHFVTNKRKGIFIVTINFNDKFWETVVATVYKFYCQQKVPSFLMEALPHDNFHTKKLFPSGVDQQIQ